MLEGLMQDDYQLTLQHILGRMRRVVADGQLVSLTAPTAKLRTTYAEVARRCDQLASGLASLGVGAGDRVATLCWNHQSHLEAYLAVPSMGAVLHTLNLRLSSAELAYIINHAGDKVLIVDASLLALIEPVRDQLPTVEHLVVVDARRSGLPESAVDYEELLASTRGAGFDYPDLDERAAAGLCYTSGTTGTPRGALFSHRSTMLQLLGVSAGTSIGVGPTDRVIVIVPMFHVNAWCHPYMATFAGADLIMPGEFRSAETLAWLIESEAVTIAGAVPTVWMDLLRFADEHRCDLSSLRLAITGGAAAPLSLMQGLQERHGVTLIQGWGMTETSSQGTFTRSPRNGPKDDPWRYRLSVGQPSLLVEMRLMDGEAELPWDGTSAGELEVRGPWIASGYYGDPNGAGRFHDGWLRTGDIGTITADGYLTLTDRVKDVIKSGGEWISSVMLENEIMAHPDVAEAAVIAIPDARWTERPLACVVPRGGQVDPVALRQHLSTRVVKWWLPSAFTFLDEVPKTGTGKFDKRALRERLARGELEVLRTDEVGAQPAAPIASE